MNDRDDFDDDEELRARLRAADPAAHLPPADLAGTDRLLEDIMSDNNTTLARPARAWLVVAAACVLMLGVGFAAVWQPWSDDTQAPTAGNDPSEAAEPTGGTGGTDDAVEATRLVVPEATGRCALPSAEILSHYETAFRGKASAATDRVITLDVGTVFAGEPGNLVELTGALNRAAGADGGRSGAGNMTGAPVFEPGKEYLIAATGDTIALCGLSGEVTPERTAMFEEAF